MVNAHISNMGSLLGGVGGAQGGPRVIPSEPKSSNFGGDVLPKLVWGIVLGDSRVWVLGAFSC